MLAAFKSNQCLLSFQQLERRDAPALFVVGTTIDGAPGSLREAIIAANANGQDDTIMLGAGTHLLSIPGRGDDAALTGDLDITEVGHSLTIQGVSADATIIDAQLIDRAFHVLPGVTLSLLGVSLRNGAVQNAGFDANGGLLLNDGGSVTIRSSRFSNSSAQVGGAIDNLATGDMLIESTEFFNNSARADGAAMRNVGELTIRQSSFHDNVVLSSGNTSGAIEISFGNQSVLIENSTFYNNTANNSGAIAIRNTSSAEVTIRNSTFAHNTARFRAGGIGVSTAGMLILQNTLVANNSASGPIKDMHVEAGSVVVSNGHNLVGDPTGATGLLPSDLVGIDPMLGSPGTHGGETPTYSLLPYSPAIDAADNAVAPGMDQRNVARPVDGNFDGDPIADIGAYEFSADVTVGSDRIVIGPIEWTIDQSGNGHWYSLVLPLTPDDRFSWSEARIAAEAMSFNSSPGHLATVTSSGENGFLRSNFSQWLFESRGPSGEFSPDDVMNAWIGLYAATTTSNFQWTTGESQGYFNWAQQEPNFVGTNLWQYVHYWTRDFGSGPTWTWNNEQDAGHPLGNYGFFVEFDGPFTDPQDTIDYGDAPNSYSTANTQLATVFEDDFEGGTSEWNDNSTFVGNSNFTEFLGPFGGVGHAGGVQQVFKTFTLSGNQDAVQIEFDFYEIDSWDGRVHNEAFQVFVDDAITSSILYDHTRRDSPGGIVSTLLPSTGNADLGFMSFEDQTYRYSMLVNSSATTIKLGFGASIEQADEAWGIDNVVIRELQTLSASAARHIAMGPLLGQLRDAEADGQPTVDATGDGTDEDGVTFGSIVAGDASARITVDVQNAPSGAKLSAWIDFNGDGTFSDLSDQIFASVDVGQGLTELTFAVPSQAIAGLTHARFRLSTAEGLTSVGEAPDGEVEDYRVEIVPDGALFFGDQGSVFRSRLDGSDVVRIMDTLGASSSARSGGWLDIDHEADKLYYRGATDQGGIVARMDFDGTDFEILVDGLPLHAFGISVDSSNDRIYFGSFPNGIFTADLEGDNVTPLANTTSGFDLLRHTHDIEVLGDRVFYTNAEHAQFNRFRGIRSADLDGTNVIDVYDHGLQEIDSVLLAIDEQHDRIYWSEFRNGLIRRADLDGSNSEVFIAGIPEIYDLEIDAATDTLYYTTWDNICRISLDGSGQECIVGLSGAADSKGLAVLSATEQVSPPVTFDYGDAPESFGTTLAANGARHLATGPRLGSLRDAETDGQPTVDATGDGADEDGVTFGVIVVADETARLSIDVQNAPNGAKLSAWIDFDGDGTFSATSDQIFSSVDVTEGPNELTFTVPADAIAGMTFARFRLSSAGNLSPSGDAADGEIEDYQVNVSPAGAFLYGDDLIVSGNSAANWIVLSQPNGPDFGVFVRYDNKSLGPFFPTNAVVINGNGGNDTIVVSEPFTLSVLADGGTGNDYLAGSVNDDTLVGGNGNDVILGGEGDNFLDGGRGNDRLVGRSGTDIIFGGEGNDQLNGGAGNDTIDGGVGADTLFGGQGDDILFGGMGLNDDAADILTDSQGNDVLFGGGGDDTISGGDGDDLLIGGLGSDRILADTGNDELRNGTAATESAIDTALRQLAAGSATLWDSNVLPALTAWRSVARNSSLFGPFTDDDDRDTLVGSIGADLIDSGLDDILADFNVLEGDTVG